MRTGRRKHARERMTILKREEKSLRWFELADRSIPGTNRLAAFDVAK
jgi:hypothetical protein